MSNNPSARITLDSEGLVPAICQNATDGEVLMLAYVNPSTIDLTLKSKQMVFFSRSREQIWHKGSTSGNYMNVESVHLDCDSDAFVFRVIPDGPACHTGSTSCFFNPLPATLEYQYSQTGPGILSELFQLIQQRQTEMPEKSYTTQLFNSGTSRIAQKVAEEASEVAIAAASGDRESLPSEVSDLLYHTLVLLADTGLSPEAVWKELRNRRAQHKPTT